MNPNKTIAAGLLAFGFCLVAQGAFAAKTVVDGVIYHCNTENLRASVQGFADGVEKSKLTIPDKITYKNKSYKVTSIANEAFHGWDGIKSITIGNYVETIGTSAFAGTNVKTLTLPAHLKIIGQAAFASTPLLDIEFPASIEIIRADAFRDCSNLKSVRFNGNKLTEIGDRAFSWCRALSSFSMPSSVKTLGKEAFDDCVSLKSIDLSPALTVIPDCAFQMCPIQYLNIPPSVTHIGVGAFCGHATSTLNIPGTVKTIGESAFELGSGQYLILNEGIVNIGKRAFACSKIVAVKLPASAVNIGKSVFEQCYALNQVELAPSLSLIPDRMFYETNISELIIPSGVTHIGEEAFYSNYRLWDIKFPQSLRVIGKRAFRHCDNLESMTLNEGLQIIGDEAFGFCNAHELIIPASVSQIGEVAFSGFHYLNRIFVENPLPPSLGSDAFSGVYSSARLIPPSGSESAYASAQEWSRFKKIGQTSNIVPIQSNDAKLSQPCFFDFSGRPVHHPARGRSYIRIRQGAAPEKIMK